MLVDDALAALDDAPITRRRPGRAGRARPLRRLARPVTRPRARPIGCRRPCPSASPAIEVADLEKHYGEVRAVDGVSLRIAAGEVFGLLGPNGAGKTTTVEILEGYRTPDAGAVRVLGLDPVRDGAQLRPRIGVMLQEGGLYPGLRPLELLRLFAAYYEDPDDPDELLDLVGLRDAGRTHRAPAVRRAAPAPVARARARSAGPRWCSSTSRPRAWTRTRAPRPGTRARARRRAASP